MNGRYHGWRRWMVSGVIMAALTGLLAVQGCASSTGGANLAPAPLTGRTAPDFRLTDLNGNTVTLSKLRGKTVFLNFWASWCVPCREEMPEIQKTYLKYKDKGVVIIGIDLFEPENDVRQFVRDGNYGWTFVIDKTQEVTSTYRVTGIPTSLFIDKNGVIRAMNTGAMHLATIDRMLGLAMR
ncbi:MAG: redoxin domain-containing protein [Chloroflexi bacterium]|nr:redoxin domain-containing protein [Chloroflexota bacterium]